MATENNYQPPVLIAITDWAKFHRWPPLGGLRHLVFNAKKNGFEKVIKRCGRRILIDEKKFFEFVEQKNKETFSKS